LVTTNFLHQKNFKSPDYCTKYVIFSTKQHNKSWNTETISQTFIKNERKKHKLIVLLKKISTFVENLV